PKFRWGGGAHSLLFEKIISLENLFAAWREFRLGKTSKLDVQAFELNIEDHIFALHEDLQHGRYAHGPYESFFVNDPKRRHIHKPPVRDRLLHHAIFRIIEPLFERILIYDAWSCRTSQLFANVYLNELDQYVKRILRIKHYVRYCDDFVILHSDRVFLEQLIPVIQKFLTDRLHLSLHPDKVVLGPYHNGVDFLGFVCFPYYRILRTKTRKRMLRRFNPDNSASYAGLVKHGRSFKLCFQLQIGLL
ncbi:RNA-directed DNA polymerase, partial [Candidatus Uhrbacteria bacterium]|nr:RNA-directed DNA polymerase [Candidatus Uhrbacteria bacterium]